MAKLTLLGSAYAVADEHHDHSHMLLTGNEHVILIDCSAHPIVRMRRAGIDPLSVTDMILTHFHPDHVSGFALFILDSWLLGRKTSLKVFGLNETLDRVEIMLDLYKWQRWPDLFPVEFIRLPVMEKAPVMDCSEFSIYASPNRHMIDAIGLRMDFHLSGRSLVYSSDTAPSPEIVRLATGVDVLIHESAGPGVGHSSPSQAGEIARQAGAIQLYLIHYNPELAVDGQLEAQARAEFDGPVVLAEDFMTLSF